MRKLFGTDGVRGIANKYPITADLALKLGKAASVILRNGKKKPVFLIGKDTRLSGYMLEYALTSGITSTGADVFLVGPMPTPAIAHLTRSFAADAGIVISASHNPAEDNGIKFFDNAGFKLPDSTEEKIEQLIFGKNLDTYNVPADQIGRAHRIDDADGRYIEFAKGSINNLSLKGIRIALDCANGAAYKVSPKIFAELGAELIVMYNKPDGQNINKECGALHPEIVRAAVLGHNADIGIALDGDADRIILVDEKGNILDGDQIMAMCALNLSEKDQLSNNAVVVTEYSNLAIDFLMQKQGMNVIRVKNGDRYVIEEMRKNHYNLGGEQSGHIIFLDHNTTGDGTIAALQVLKLMQNKNKKLSALAKVLDTLPQVLINVGVKKKLPFEQLPAVQEALSKAEKELGKEGRIIVRYSGTQMMARVMLEGRDDILIKKLANKIAESIKKEIGV
ncbi:phosphoglucosamine mutase [Candidatus Woesearchaeota archaeon]|nr:phosphoglucosamine mutase [Candidatus Woesearchaeota archaeon]